MRHFSISRTWRHLKRYNQIISVLIKYGFSDIVDAARKDLIARFGEKFIPRGRKSKISGLSQAQRIRLALDELGPTFVKLGQVLSLRPDIIPVEIAVELAKLQDEVSPLPYEIIANVIQTELACEPEKVFQKIQPQPLAAASLAQVHKGVLNSGEPVAIKVQRPEAQALIDTDIEILYDLAFILQKYFLENYALDILAFLHEFDRSIHQELDFILEGRNLKRFRKFFAGDEYIFIPDYFAEYSTSKLLVMELVEGIKATEIEQLKAAGIDLEVIAQRGVEASFRQVFEFGFFHADPHPGNIMILPGNIIAPIDFGMVGQIDEDTIDILGNVVVSVLHKDITRIIRALEDLTGMDLSAVAHNLRFDIMTFINNYSDLPLKDLQLSLLMDDFFGIVRKYHLQIPSHLALMSKALVTVEGLARILWPDFDVLEALKPYVRKITFRRYDPRRIVQDGSLVVDDFAGLITDLPGRLRAIFKKAAEGNFAIQFQHRNLEHLIDEFRKAANQLSLALILAALVVGSSLVILTMAGPKLFGYSLIGVLGYLAALLLSLRMLWNYFRKK
ncbi:MAG TPA: AarF/UbiB family protein [Candidatus Marinimicrobia bacterium]|nr:AarF/UbiB family protein [Candidatus Neomarinimicrobiota bacterium]HRS50990.1 AarF/UbiB family protein [Candidatus Neomarinimicrobiota bacterium]HRU91668.1 AarF/UbiB family protein [Candidatus Neomarinimicrobiota bacterium]